MDVDLGTGTSESTRFR